MIGSKNNVPAVQTIDNVTTLMSPPSELFNDFFHGVDDRLQSNDGHGNTDQHALDESNHVTTSQSTFPFPG